jgi:hypothetical protein
MILLRGENGAMPTDCWAIENYTYRSCPPHPHARLLYGAWLYSSAGRDRFRNV